MIHVITRIERPSSKTIESFSELAAATIHEASGRKGYIDCAIKPINRGLRICGPAFTVQCGPGDNIMLHKALECAQPGDVIVATVGGAFDYGYFGYLMATSAMAKGLKGLCIDGCIRDSAEIIAAGFPVFARGFCIRGTSKNCLGLINHPTDFGGQTIHPGDLIVGDDDGLVVVKLAECEDILEKSKLRVANEIKKEAVLKSGVSSVEFNNLGPILSKAGLEQEK